MLTFPVAFVLLLASVAAGTEGPAPFGAQGRDSPKASLGIYAAEAGGAIVGTLALGGLFAVYTIYLPAYIDQPGPIHWSPPALAVASVSVGLFGCAGGTSIVGSAFKQGGEFLPALGYAAATTAAGVALCVVSTELHNTGTVSHDVHLGITYTGVALFFATPFAAVYGYNRSRPRDSVGSRFLPGLIGLRSKKDGDGTTHAFLDIGLLNVRF